MACLRITSTMPVCRSPHLKVWSRAAREVMGWFACGHPFWMMRVVRYSLSTASFATGPDSASTGTEPKKQGDKVGIKFESVEPL